MGVAQVMPERRYIILTHEVGYFQLGCMDDIKDLVIEIMDMCTEEECIDISNTVNKYMKRG